MSTAGPATPAEAVRLGTPAGRRVLLAAVLGSGLASVDATVVDVALPAIGADLEGSLADCSRPQDTGESGSPRVSARRRRPSP